MPYKYTDPWHIQLRAYMREIGPTVAKDTVRIYRWRLDVCGKVLGYPDPRTIALITMRTLENQLPGVEANRSILARTLKTFLEWTGNRDAKRWKVSVKARPKVDGMFLTEEAVATARAAAVALGPLHHLLFSLGVDNGLRTVDMRRLTMQNAWDLGRYHRTMILGKGRNGGKPGPLELSRMTDPALGAYLDRRREISMRWNRDWDELIIYERTFPPACAGPPAYYTINLLLHDVATASGVQFRPHDLRRTYGNRLHRHGVPIETIAKLMRHENINQAFRSYIGIDSDEMRAAQDLLLPK